MELNNLKQGNNPMQLQRREAKESREPTPTHQGSMLQRAQGPSPISVHSNVVKLHQEKFSPSRRSIERDPYPQRVTALESGAKVMKSFCSSEHMFCLTSEHRIYAWGLNTNGRLGLPSYKQDRKPNLIKFPVLLKSLDNKKIDGLSAGNDHTFAWSSETSCVYGWGSGAKGKLGNDCQGTKPEPFELECLIEAAKVGFKVINITCGDAHTLATFKCMTQSLHDTHKLFLWGKNDMGQLGIDNEVAQEVTIPTQISQEPDPFNDKLMSVHAGPSSYSAALTTEGVVYTWGNGLFGRLGYVSKFHYEPRVVQSLNGIQIVRIALGYYHVAVVSNEGEVFTWGRGQSGQLGSGHIIAEDSPAKVSTNLEGYFIIDASCGETHSAALSDKGDMFTWGSGNLGQLGHGDMLRQSLPLRVAAFDEMFVKAICCGKSHTSAITANGNLYTWGSNEFSQLGRFTQQSYLFLRSTSTSGSGFSSAKTSPSMVYPSHTLNAPLSKGSNSSAGEASLGPQKFEFPIGKNQPVVGQNSELNKIAVESIFVCNQSPHMSAGGSSSGGGGGSLVKKKQSGLASPSSLRKLPGSTKHENETLAHKIKQLEIKQLQIPSAGGTPTEPQIPRRLQHIYEQTPKYIKNLKSDLNLALKKNMELRRKIEEDYAVESVISVGDKYRTLIEESETRALAVSLLENARHELESMQGHQDLRIFTERMLESLFKAKWH